MGRERGDGGNGKTSRSGNTVETQWLPISRRGNGSRHRERNGIGSLSLPMCGWVCDDTEVLNVAIVGH